jgi:hypothetical protein
VSLSSVFCSWGFLWQSEPVFGLLFLGILVASLSLVFCSWGSLWQSELFVGILFLRILVAE